MAKFAEFTFPSSDGLHDIHCSLWLPDEGAPKGVVQIVHGISEYVNRYDHLARFLTDHGYAVCGEDHLGHGRTGKQDNRFGVFSHRDGWALVTDDVRALRKLMGEKFPSIPYFLLGHSMGSFLVRTYLCRFPGEVDGALLSGTGQEPGPVVAAGKLLAGLIAKRKGYDHFSPLVHDMALGAYNKQFAPNRTSADWTTRDEAVVDTYVADPFCQIKPTVSLYRDMLGGLQYIASPRALSQMDPNTPVYLYSGDQDPVGANGKGVRKVHGYFQKHGTKDLSLKLYAGGRHEMHNEINKEEVFSDVLVWLEKHS